MASEKRIVKPQPMSGFPEWLPGERLVELRLLDKIRQAFELFGFAPIETPAVERMEILEAKGEIRKQIYRLSRPEIESMEEGEKVDWKETEFALHFDLTVPLARYVAQYYHQLTFPFRRYQIQKVWRGERPQKGRVRELYQCDIDIIGDGELSLMADAEIPCVIYQVFTELDIGDFRIHLNNRKVLEGVLMAVGVEEEKVFPALLVIDEIKKIGRETVERRLRNEVHLPAEVCSQVMSVIVQCGAGQEAIRSLERQPVQHELFWQGLAELREVVTYLQMFGLPEEAYVVDLSIARGLDYYTGIVYETMLQKFPDYGSVCSGGRYDDLASRFIDRQLPGVGISIGLTRLFAYLRDVSALKVNSQTPTRVLVTTQDRSMLSKYLELTAFLRNKGIPTEIYLEAKELKHQMRYAHKKGIPLVVIANAEEIGQDEYVLKNMVTGDQKRVSLARLPDEIVGW